MFIFMCNMLTVNVYGQDFVVGACNVIFICDSSMCCNVKYNFVVLQKKQIEVEIEVERERDRFAHFVKMFWHI